MKLVTLLDNVVNELFTVAPVIYVGADNAVQRAEVDRIVIATVRQLGFEVNAHTGDIYNPAMPDGSTDLIPRQQNVRYAGMPSRASRARVKRRR